MHTYIDVQTTMWRCCYHTYIYIYTYICMHLYVFVYFSVYIYIHTYTSIYQYLYIYIYMLIHIYISICIRILKHKKPGGDAALTRRGLWKRALHFQTTCTSITSCGRGLLARPARC